MRTGREIVEGKFYNYIDNYTQKCDESVRGYVNYISGSSPRTVALYMRFVNNFLKEIGKEPTELTFNDFSNYMAEHRRNEDGKDYTPSYRIQMFAALKRYNEYLVASGYLSTNYMLMVPRPKAGEKQETIAKREKGYLTPNEIRRVLRGIERDAEDGIRDMAVFQVFLNTGMRLSALVSLNVDDYDSQKKTIAVTDKGNKVRFFVIGDSASEALNKWLKERERLISTNNSGFKTNALFIMKKMADWEDSSINEEHYGRISIHGMERLVKRRTKVIFGKHITPHKLRATYGTQLYDKTHDIYFVQQCMGHSNPKTTQIYIRGEENCTKKASEIMDDLLS